MSPAAGTDLREDVLQLPPACLSVCLFITVSVCPSPSLTDLCEVRMSPAAGTDLREDVQQLPPACLSVCLFIIVSVCPSPSLTDLCEVRIRVLPLARTWERMFHSCRLAPGSMPEDGSSSRMTAGPPTSAMAVLSLRLLPPLPTQTYVT